MKSALSIACFLLTAHAVAQDKYEQEFRVRGDEVPESASRAVSEMALEGKIKWYEERSNDGTSYEAKTRHDGKRFSVEFDELGNFEDLEIEMDPSELPEKLSSELCRLLEDEYEKHRIDKIQLQLSGNQALINSYIKEHSIKPGITTKYEVIVIGKRNGTFRDYEYLLTQDGAVEKLRKIVNRPPDNLIY